MQGLVEEALREGGFDTAILSSGEEALTLFRGKVAPYRALVTDVNLKGSLSGREVARQIREMEAGFPVIYMTGASADQWTAHGVPDSILLRKPFARAAGHGGLAASQRRRADGHIAPARLRPMPGLGTFPRRRL
ncbi:response regulator [Bradyrhizobium sp. 190]|uniref:response regulator n=1 Tax=Bradyrhizobium sp. 190 TaxID=2782658 RepID=UPI0027E1BC2C|nr:response regulator [Bradyrhizobium sp. 190]